MQIFKQTFANRYSTPATVEPQQKLFTVIGRQGCRSIVPGNTTPSFIQALKTGVEAVELDIMMSADGQLIVTDHAVITPLNYYHPEIKYDVPVYQLTADELSKFDCGKRFNSRYPYRKMISTSIPVLKDVIGRMEKYILWNHIKPVQYFIDIKTSPETDGIYHPKPEEMVIQLVDLIRTLNISRRCTVISSDVRPLQHVQRLNQKINIALKVENEESVQDNVDALGFTPSIYMLHFHKVTRENMYTIQAGGMRMIPFGANDLLDLNELYAMGVDGLLTDNPDHALKLIEK
ncbi:MAG: glycerophosphodiester phosphodiesterase family protein [Bacteroidota bacterium]